MRATILLLVLASCGGVPSLAGLDEPLVVRGATFIEGDLETQAGGPTVTAVETATGIVRRGQTERLLAGRVSPEAHAIAVRWDNVGRGWWVLPVLGPDPGQNNELVWRAQIDVAHDAPLGRGRLLFAAIDEAGRAGVTREAAFCVRPDWPDELNACDPTRKPPDAVVVLEWSADVDLDLELGTPDGRRVGAKHPTSALSVDGVIPKAALEEPTLARLDRDSDAACSIDGRRRETIAFAEAPAGTWSVFVNLYDACHQPGTQFRVRVLRRQDAGDGTWRQVESAVKEGAWTAAQASGAGASALYLTSISFD